MTFFIPRFASLASFGGVYPDPIQIFTIVDPTSPLETRNKILNFENLNNPSLLGGKQTLISKFGENITFIMIYESWRWLKSVKNWREKIGPSVFLPWDQINSASHIDQSYCGNVNVNKKAWFRHFSRKSINFKVENYVRNKRDFWKQLKGKTNWFAKRWSDYFRFLLPKCRSKRE